MTRAQVIQVREALESQALSIQQAISSIAGIKVKVSVGNATFGAGEATFKVKLLEVAPTGEVFDPFAENYKRYASTFFLGMPTPELGTTFEMADGTFKIVGLKPSAHKRPIVLEKVSNGKQYVASIAQVRIGLKLAEQKVPIPG